MKVIIAYPPLEAEKGFPTIGQNRQFQYFKEPTFIYPMVPASAATLLKAAGHEVIWLDAIAQGLPREVFFKILKNESPDLIAFEAKAPIIKQLWKIINELKTNDQRLTTVLFGDHVTALPEESFSNSQVDFVLTGGDYDFLLLSLCNELSKLSFTFHLSPFTQFEPGIYWRQDSEINNSGPFKLNHDLNKLAFIDRDLTRWELYAEKNGNYKKTPGTYIMSGRDCWWSKCTFCLSPSTSILTNHGTMLIHDIVDNGISPVNDNLLVLTHKGNFSPISKFFKRRYNGKFINIEIFSLKQDLQLTPNHKILALRRSLMKRCSKKCCWSYLCVPDRISKRMNCASCRKQYYNGYDLDFIESGLLQKGDFVAVPIIRKTKDKEYIDVKAVLETEPLIVQVTKKKSDALINKIINKYNVGYSQRRIAKELGIDRQTVKRYIILHKNNELIMMQRGIVEEGGYIKYEYGKKWVPTKIPLSDDFLRLVGYYLAEGHVTSIKNRPNSYCLCLTFSAKEETYIKDVAKIVNGIFKKIDVREHSNKKNKTVQVEINSSVLALLFKRFFGDNSYNKKLPDYFLFLPLEKQKELLKGLFRGDGHLRIRSHGKGGTEYILETVSGAMANQVMTILFRNEAIPRLRAVPPRGKEALKYFISLCQYDIGHIFPEINLEGTREKVFRHGFVLGDFILIPIKEITKYDYNGLVYNLEIEKDHSYTANNIAVSNCSWPTMYPEFRSRAPENVLDEIEILIAKYRVREIMDDSGCFPAGAWLEDFCQGIIKRGINKKIYLDCNMRFGALSKADFTLMRKANFRLLLFGLESANQKTLDRINKKIRVEQITEDCKIASSAGLFPHITIMFGYPWESYADALYTLRLGKWLLKKGFAYTMQATIVIPYPGTRLFEECRREGLLRSVDWDDYDMKRGVMKSPISDEKLLGLVQGMYGVSFSPEFITRKLSRLRDFDDLKYGLRAAKKVCGHILDFKKK